MPPNPSSNSRLFDNRSLRSLRSISTAQPFESAVIDDQSTGGDTLDVEGGSIPGHARGRPVRNRRRTNSSVGPAGQFLSTSYGGTDKRPTRSFLHSASHAPDEPLQFSSEGVRKQTQELASWALNESPTFRKASISTQPGGETEHDRRPSNAEPLHQDSIEEESTGDESSAGGSSRPKSRLSELIREGKTAMAQRTEQDEDAAVRGRDRGRSFRKSIDERAPLLSGRRLSEASPTEYSTNGEVEFDGEPWQYVWQGKKKGIWATGRANIAAAFRTIKEPRRWSRKAVLQQGLVGPIRTLPAVFLGWLLNVLDALSYGMILFPLGHPLFEHTGPDGISIFLVSCIVSQLIYSCGASAFRGAVGSEMIEVVPFFHKMTYLILAQMGPSAEPSAIFATVITSYALSSILTGLIFFFLGALRLGSLVSFFPRSILTGCIGGVGIFLFITGIEVSARLEGNLSYDFDMLNKLFSAGTAALWLVPLGLAVLLRVLKKVRDHEALLPTFFIAIVVIFYVVVLVTPNLDLDHMRRTGWVFEKPGSDVPFWRFYTYFKFSQVDGTALMHTVPSMFALAFFGILHVPINVPALAVAVGEDDINVNRELIAHGLSNTISGAVGSVQNYLVYANSAIFIRNGGDSRLAGLLLAAVTTATWIAGPGLVGYIPVMIVGALIYFLGIELIEEALWDSFGKAHKLEYVMIMAIALIMGFYDFVAGIMTGIVLACLIFVLQTSQVSAIRASYSGVVAKSTVRRNPLQRRFLREVGSQIYLAKLAGYLFFGTIVAVENQVRELVDEERFFQRPIKYFIFDLQHVTGIDFSAADAFSRMHRILRGRNVEMLLSGLSPAGTVGRSLTMVNLLDEEHADPEYPPPRVFEDLNQALEACENDLLQAFRARHEALFASHQPSEPLATDPLPVSSSPKEGHIAPSTGLLGLQFSSPRRALVQRAAHRTLTEHGPSLLPPSGHATVTPPLPLLLQAFRDVSPRDLDFWHRCGPYLERRGPIPAGAALFRRGDPPDGFYLLESGVLRAESDLEQGRFYESVVAGSTCGELPFFAETARAETVVAETECVCWVLTRERWAALQKEEPEVAAELMKVALKLAGERMDAITNFVLVMAS